MLVLTRKLNESIMIGDAVEVTVVEVKGEQVKLGIRAPRDVKVHRKEIFEAIQRENVDASKLAVDRIGDSVARIGGIFKKKHETAKRER
jgi:carbon storage regulator